MRQRRQHERVQRQRGTQRAGGGQAQVGQRHATDQQLGQPLSTQGDAGLAQFVGCVEAERVGHEEAVEQPFARFGLRQGLRQQFVQFEHLDATLAHLVHEMIEVELRPLDPDRAVELQLAAAARRQAQVRQARAAHENGAQFAHLGVNAALRSRPDVAGHGRFVVRTRILVPTRFPCRHLGLPLLRRQRPPWLRSGPHWEWG